MNFTMSPQFKKNNDDMLQAAARCIEMRQHIPALVLIYSHIDTLAWAGASKENKKNVGKNFENWVSKWLLPELIDKAPTLTAIELYAARCAIVHTLTGTSKLSTSGKARRIVYAWGAADAQFLDEMMSLTEFSNLLITLHYDVLFNAFSSAINRFIESASTDAALREQLEEAAGQHYVNVPLPDDLI